MGLIGAGIGAYCGNRWGILGTLIGGVMGHCLEEQIRKGYAERQRQSPPPHYGSDEENPDSLRIGALGALAAMLAKMAKADGRISEEEIACCEDVFRRLGLDGDQRSFCIKTFTAAARDTHSVYEYTEAFASAQPNREIREILYGILWDLACADRTLSDAEARILREIPAYLGVDPGLYDEQLSRRRRQRQSSRPESVPPTDPYVILGCPRNATNDELQRAYREKSKHLHPDVLRSKGLPPELMQEASRLMTQLNSAWNAIKRERFARA